ncbi:MAG TPA: YceI family protein [Rhizomicrobium sp.]|jgi:polyisoprenoid-binding protein YceI
MRTFLLLASAVLLIGPAQAASWNVDPAKSKLGFSVLWSKEAFSAAFKKWNATIVFDPADLPHAHVNVTVDLASEASDEPDFDSGLKGAEGFQTSHFPAAHFDTTKITHQSGNTYMATGTLSLRGVTRSIAFPFTLTISGHNAHMIATAHVIRTDFGVGQGNWASADPVAHDVSVNIDLTATQAS